MLVARAKSMKRMTTQASPVCPAGSRSRRAACDVPQHASPLALTSRLTFDGSLVDGGEPQFDQLWQSCSLHFRDMLAVWVRSCAAYHDFVSCCCTDLICLL